MIIIITNELINHRVIWKKKFDKEINKNERDIKRCISSREIKIEMICMIMKLLNYKLNINTF